MFIVLSSSENQCYASTVEMTQRNTYIKKCAYMHETMPITIKGTERTIKLDVDGVTLSRGTPVATL